MIRQGMSAYDYGFNYTSGTDLGEETDTFGTSVDDSGNSLYRICNEHFPPDVNQQTELNEAQQQMRKASLENAWSMIRRWFKKHQDEEYRHKAASYLDQYSLTPLHLCCKSPGTPYDIIEALVNCNPKTVRWCDHQGWLPLHYACAHDLSLEVLTFLCDKYPEGKLIQDKKQRTALHFAFFRKEGTDQTADTDEYITVEGEVQTNNKMPGVVELLGNSGACSIPDESGLLPMHYACAYGAIPTVLQILFKHDNTCIHAQEKNGRTPVHYAMSNSFNAKTPRVLKFLLAEGGIGIMRRRDNYGNLPIHLLVSAARNCPEEKKKKFVIESMKTFLNTQPKIDAEMFSAIQSLPTWLRDHVVIHPHMQTILNRKVAKPHHCLLVVVDFIAHVCLLIGFEVSTFNTISRLANKDGHHVDESWSFYFLVSSAIWFILRELMQICGLLNLGKIRSWFNNYTHYFDIVIICSIIFFSVVTDDAKRNQLDMTSTDFANVVAWFKLIYYTKFIFFIRSFNKTFAVFASGVAYVLNQLWAFLIMLSFILLMFTFAFYFLSYKVIFCKEDSNEPDTCSPGSSFLRMLTMMLGEMGNFISDFRKDGDPGNPGETKDFFVVHIFYLVYAFIVVIVLSNMLIAITTESYGFIKNERAVMVFWSNRLDQVAENDAVVSLLRKLFMCEKREEVQLGPSNVREQRGGPGVAETQTSSQRQRKGFQGSMYKLWDELIGVFSSEGMEGQSNSFCNFDFILLTITRIVVCIIIPIWLLVGLLTLSVLWPPQIREWFLGQKLAIETTNTTDKELWVEFDKFRKEMALMRKKLKEDMKMDRSEIDGLNFEVFDVQKNVMEDMLQVKEIMTSLLDLMKTDLARREYARNA